MTTRSCHCEECSDEAISVGYGIATHLSGARNDKWGMVQNGWGLVLDS